MRAAKLPAPRVTQPSAGQVGECADLTAREPIEPRWASSHSVGVVSGDDVDLARVGARVAAAVSQRRANRDVVAAIAVEVSCGQAEPQAVVLVPSGDARVRLVFRQVDDAAQVVAAQEHVDLARVVARPAHAVGVARGEDHVVGTVAIDVADRVGIAE